ncbi:MAG: hypothetical protein HKO96_02360 [Flavobacteriaceae bacterium]|nr:hypothetical protein [Bacteroidia bacterium]NNK69292.1 hypothetical protein [Flavobacteriaceae bacterium]
MTPNINRTYTILAILFVCCQVVFGHGELSLRIAEKTQQINKEPTNAQLFFERGFLYHQHEEFDLALRDYEQSESLGLKSEELYYRKAETNFTISYYENTIQALQSYFELNPYDVKGRKLYAKTLYKLNQINRAYIEYKFVIEHISDPRPDDYLMFSEITRAHNNDDLHEALKVINLGLETLGEDTVTLQLERLELLKAMNNTDLVIEQYNYFLNQTDRKEFWYFRKASFLKSTGRINDAKIASQQAKVAISVLREKFKNTDAIIKLEKDIVHLDKSLNYED